LDGSISDSGSSVGIPLDVMAFVVLVVAFVASTVLFFLFQTAQKQSLNKLWLRLLLVFAMLMEILEKNVHRVAKKTRKVLSQN
jgi:hypothetical protein